MLPEGVEEILPAEAKQIEALRRKVLDELDRRGFELVMPPVMEFVDSLLTGTGEELDTQTYKFMDQHTQRMLGIRADMTPQIARIDAHYLSHRDVNRLCYAGTVLRTRPDQMGGQRELLQVGAEVFGIADESADLDILEAMLATLHLGEATQITLSLGHVDVYSALKENQQISGHVENTLFDVLQRKSLPDLNDLAASFNIKPFVQMLEWQGDASVIQQVGAWLQENIGETSDVQAELVKLQTVADHLSKNHPTLDVHIDFADVLGYRYHTGLKYSAFVSGRGRAIAKGGRYDRVGEHFGRARPATGFSADLKSLFRI